MLCTIYCARFVGSGEPVVATGLDLVTDKGALVSDPPRDDADVELTVINAPSLDGVVDRIGLSIRAVYQRHVLTARFPLEVRVDHPVTRGVGMFNPFDVTLFGKLARNHQRTLAIARIPEMQCERRVVGIAEPVHRVERDSIIRVPDRRTHRTRVPDRQRLMRVTHERRPDTLLDREPDEDVRRLEVDLAGWSTTIRSRERDT